LAVTERRYNVMAKKKKAAKKRKKTSKR